MKKDKNQVDTHAKKETVTTDEPPMLADDFGPDHVWQDDGQTSFADMDLTRPVYKQRRTKKNGLDLSRKEHSALMRAALRHYLPAVLSVLCGFAAAALLMFWWLGR